MLPPTLSPIQVSNNFCEGKEEEVYEIEEEGQEEEL